MINMLTASECSQQLLLCRHWHSLAKEKTQWHFTLKKKIMFIETEKALAGTESSKWEGQFKIHKQHRTYARYSMKQTFNLPCAGFTSAVLIKLTLVEQRDTTLNALTKCNYNSYSAPFIRVTNGNALINVGLYHFILVLRVTVICSSVIQKNTWITPEKNNNQTSTTTFQPKARGSAKADMLTVPWKQNQK